MAITGDGIQFLPLYWGHHDCWRYYRRNTEIVSGNPVVSMSEFDHWGHVHLFMLGFNWDAPGQDAFSGSQSFNFALKDIWGPRSADPNQQHQMTVVGTPVWYFHVTETWRRIYIHPWDRKVSTDRVAERRGIKWEASPPDGTFGPFREGRDAANRIDYVPAMLQGARTLPLEYFKSQARSQAARDNFVGDKAAEILKAYALTKAEEAFADLPVDEQTDEAMAALKVEKEAEFYDAGAYSTDHSAYVFAGGNSPLGGEEVSHAGVPPFSDRLYIWPLIEYQQVVQLDWQRLPGAESANPDGDGWSLALGIPFVNPLTGAYNSPFGPNAGEVRPIGQYFGTDGKGSPLVPTSRKMKYTKTAYDDPLHPPIDRAPRYYGGHPFDQDPATSEQLVSFHDPYNDQTGRWIQQCLGGVIQARAVVTLQSKLGGQFQVRVDAVNYLPTTPFAGTDQAAPAVP